MEIQLLGQPAVRDGPALRDVAGRQGALLAALALHARRPLSVDRLMDVVWGDAPPGDGGNALQQRISRLRSTVDPTRRADVLPAVGDGYALRVDDSQIDVRRFEQSAADARRKLGAGDARGAEAAFDEALRLWRGRALEGFADELWAMGEARRLEELRLSVAEDRIDAILSQGKHDGAVGELVELAAAHPLRERLRGQLMVALYRAGRQADALATYDETRRLLADELGVDPGPELQSVYRQILTQDAGLGVEVPAPVPPARGNLPAPRSTVVGRDHALDQVAQLLGYARLLTVTGPGGAGKTTVAVEAARRRSTPRDGAWVIELAPVSTGHAVVAAVADALGVTSGGLGAHDIDAAALTRTLAERHMLIVLDNCEHLLPAVGQFVERLLAEAAHVQVLATSREPLGLPGEVVWSVPGLGVPDEQHTTAEEVVRAPAVALLVERVRAHTPGFAVTDDTARVAATLTRRLDGMPLAIELVAARLRVLSLAEVTAALDDRFRLLARRGRTAASRHRTLRAALDWSWELLDEPLQRGLAALAVPAGRFDLSMASALLQAVAVDADALDVVADLVDRSLLDADTTATPTRYRMLESIRDYGRQRLGEMGVGDRARCAHADVVEAALGRCHAATSPLRFGVDIDGLAAWLDDARAALRWADRHGDRQRVQRIAGLLGWLWLLRGRSAEGLDWLDRGLAAPADVDPATDDAGALLWASALRAAGTRAADGRHWADLAVRAAPTPVDRILALVCAAGHHADAGHVEEAAGALGACAAEAEVIGGWPLGFVRLVAGQLAWATGCLDTARAHTEEAVALLSAAGARWGQVHALETLVDDAMVRGEHARARDLAREGLRVCRRQRYPELEAAMLTRMGLAAHHLGDGDEAARLLDEAVAGAAAVGSVTGQADARIGAGTVARRRGEVHAARDHLRAALGLLPDSHDVRETARVHVELAHTAAVAEQPEAAAAHAGDALVLARRAGDPRTLALTLEALAGAAAIADEPSPAVPLLATAAAIRDTAGVPTPPQEQRDIQRATDRVHARIGEAAFARAWAAARARAAEQPEAVVAEAVAAHVGRPRD